MTNNTENNLEAEQATFSNISSRLKRCKFVSPLEILKAHYGSTTYNRSPEQLEREKYLIPKFVPFSRWLLLPAAVIIQFCCGTLYAWSVFNEPIEMYMYGKQTNTAPVTFYVAIGCLGVSAAVFGPWLERNGPSKTAYIGTSGVFLAHLFASLAVYTKQMWFLYIGYGIVGGCSIGLCYISPVSALQKFFPDRRGMAGGFGVCGFGAGAIAASPLQLLLITSVGVPLTFVILGCSYFVVMFFAATVLRTPPPGYIVCGVNTEGIRQTETTQNKVSTNRNPPIIKFTLIEALKSRDFWLMFVMFFGNVITGLVIVCRLSDMVQSVYSKSKEDGSMVVAVNGGFNLGGRFLFSLLSDKIGRKTVFLCSLTIQAVIVDCMTPILTHKETTYWAFVVLQWILAACFGCSFSVIPAFLTDMFGASNIGACQGVMLVGWSLAGVSGLVYTSIFNSMVPNPYTADQAYPYLVNFYWLLAVIIIGFVAALFIRTNGWHRYLAIVDHRRVFYFSTFFGLLRFNVGFVEKIPPVQLMSQSQVIEECDKNVLQENTKNQLEETKV